MPSTGTCSLETRARWRELGALLKKTAAPIRQAGGAAFPKCKTGLRVTEPSGKDDRIPSGPRHRDPGHTPFMGSQVDLGRRRCCSGHVAIEPNEKMSDPLMWLGAIYCAALVAVAVWIGLMLFTGRSHRQRWSKRYQDRLRYELRAVQGRRRGTGMGRGG
jgi:hypothetical protein